MPEVHDLGLVIDSQVPIVTIESKEENRVVDTFVRLAHQRSKALYQWTLSDGLKEVGFSLAVDSRESLDEPEEALKHIKRQTDGGIYLLCDFHPFFTNPLCVRLLKDIALQRGSNRPTLVLVSHALSLPAELRPYSADFAMHLPGAAQLDRIIRDEAQEWSNRNNGKKVKTDNLTLQSIVRNLTGLSYEEARRLARGAIFDDGALTQSDIPEINRAKFALMELDSVLSYEYDTARFQDVGGLENLKEWLSHRKDSFLTENASGLEPPKGLLLLGVQGGGKSLAAKAIAGMWNVPLLRLDMGTLYNKYYGETEKNLRKALQLAELMAPCVLWIDEIEKGLGQGGNDSGVAKRVLGTLLTWMAENKAQVFLAATANDIQSLPPELVRKGRMDEIFFVDLPDTDVRRQIIHIHLRKRGLDSDRFTLPALISATEGFSGAEIEQAIVSAFYTAAAQEKEVNTDLILNELSKTQPLSVVMAEKLASLRAWARERCIPA